jgi:predicted RNA-binding protein with RPS1 domain
MKLSEGEKVKVKVLEVDKQGRIRLSMNFATANARPTSPSASSTWPVRCTAPTTAAPRSSAKSTNSSDRTSSKKRATPPTEAVHAHREPQALVPAERAMRVLARVENAQKKSPKKNAGTTSIRGTSIDPLAEASPCNVRSCAFPFF